MPKPKPKKKTVSSDPWKSKDVRVRRDTSKLRPKDMTDEEAIRELDRLRAVLKKKSKSGVELTATEARRIMGRMGGIAGRKSPGRSLGGKRGSESRWKGK